MSTIYKSKIYLFLNDFLQLILISYSIGFSWDQAYSQTNFIKVFEWIISVLLLTYYLYYYFRKKFGYTRFIILGFLTQLMLVDFSQMRLSTEPSGSEINAYILRLVIEFTLYLLICVAFRTLTNFSTWFKIAFYGLTAFLTYLFQFKFTPVNCLDVETFDQYKQCLLAMDPLNTLRNNTLNIFIICVSIFESLSGVIEWIKKWLDKNKAKSDQTSGFPQEQ